MFIILPFLILRDCYFLLINVSLFFTVYNRNEILLQLPSQRTHIARVHTRH